MFSPLDDACWYHEASVLRFSFDRLEMDSRDSKGLGRWLQGDLHPPT